MRALSSSTCASVIPVPTSRRAHRETLEPALVQHLRRSERKRFTARSSMRAECQTSHEIVFTPGCGRVRSCASDSLAKSPSTRPPWMSP